MCTCVVLYWYPWVEKSVIVDYDFQRYDDNQLISFCLINTWVSCSGINNWCKKYHQKELMVYFLTAGMIFYKLLWSVYLCTNVYILKGMVRQSFITRRAATRMNEIQSRHFWQLVQDSILSRRFYPIMTCHHYSSTADNNNDPLWKKLKYVKPLFTHLKCLISCHRYFKGNKPSIAICCLCQQTASLQGNIQLFI